ncbi:MAG: SDR family NAD(P)-dependent oxidoreductase [Promethearchaeota archaeon]
MSLKDKYTYLMEGYFVFSHYHLSNDNLSRIKHSSLMLIKGDLSNSKSITEIYYKCLSSGRTIDILINNAGTFSYADSIETIKEKDFDRVLQVNLKAPFLFSQLVFNDMKKQGWGRIINMSSIGVKFGGSPGSLPYTVSKSGLETMTIAFAKAGAPYNILVNAIRIGVTDTKFHDLNPKKNMDKRINMIPLKRMASPQEISDTVFFLTSDKSTFTTGSIITIAGGE